MSQPDTPEDVEVYHTTNGYTAIPTPDGSGWRIEDTVAGNCIDVHAADVIELAEHMGAVVDE